MREFLLEKLEVAEDELTLGKRILLSSLKVIKKYHSGKITNLSREISVLSPLLELNNSEFNTLDKSLERKKALPNIRECQVLVQKVIPDNRRKQLASYFTIDVGISFMSKLASAYYERILRKDRKKFTLADPFLGSGKTLTKTVKRIDTDRLRKIYGIELHPLSAIVGYAALLEATKGRAEIDIITGDAFQFLPPHFTTKNPRNIEADIILTNPPFTRWSKLDEGFRNRLSGMVKSLGYSKYLPRKDASLQIYSMFLVDRILNPSGLLATVLPASTFYTNYGQGYKQLLKKKYEIKAILENSDSSFSEDSGFKELILVAERSGEDHRRNTLFEKLQPEKMDEIVKEILEEETRLESGVDLHSLHSIVDRNWSFLFEKKDVRDVLLKILKHGQKNGTLVDFETLYGKNNIMRGIEMYGTNFFFIPNKYWQIIEDTEEEILIKNDENGEELKIPKIFLEKVLRRPKLYYSKIEATPGIYALAIPPHEELPEDVEAYMEYGIKTETAQPAIRAKKKYWSNRIEKWYSHIYHRIKTKEPYGNVFLPDKVDATFKNRGVFANYTEKSTVATKNFYLIDINDKDAQKLLALWFNSTIFLSIFLSAGKKISDRFIRFLGDDYLKGGVILDSQRIEKRIKTELLEIFEKIRKRQLPPLQGQLTNDELLDLRKQTDTLFLDAFEVPNPTKEKIKSVLYRWLLR